MADTIKIRAGETNTETNTMPTLAEREIAYSTDENALYIGTNEGNKRISVLTDEERQAIIDEAVAEALKNR